VSDQRRQNSAADGACSIESVFHHAGQMADPAKRAAYLEDICGEDDAMRRRVMALLAAEGKMRCFLENVEPDVPG